MSEEERKLVEQNIVYEDTLLEITPELMKKTIIEQDKEIERLNILLEDEKLNKEIAQGHKKEVQDIELQERKEIERLNNIINEFDNWLLGEKMMFYKGSDGETLIRFNETVNKWLELKGSDKE